MVIISDYDKINELNISDDIKSWFPFELSPFQKWSINALINGNHSLITAHTGSGKTVPAEFGIQYFTKLGKKVIYTTPIKALSNQKLHDFRRKFPEISFGILTGDIEDNTEADVLIMTTEILANTLMSKSIDTNLSSKSELDNKPEYKPRFNINFDSELALVVFDEVHYISDQDRGHAWEQSIILLPKNVQLLMLSATIADPDKFASWIESKYFNQENNTYSKQVVLSSTNERIVPLKHYAWFAPFKPKVMKELASKPSIFQMIESNTNKLITIRNGDSNFLETNYRNILKLKNYIINSSNCKNDFTDLYVFTNLIYFLKKNRMLPALCFLFSRNQVEMLANLIAKSGKINLFDEDDDINPIKVQKECRHILSSKLNNYLDYINLPEYSTILSLLEKGIGIHHAGVLPILRELIEILDEKGYIKLLFATETFAVGVNMPTKTVIFKSIKKFNNNTFRYLYPFEYTQMAGRAGRRGLDTVGHVIHLCNLFDLPSSNEMSNILMGSPQNIKSHFHLSYNIILNTLFKINNTLNIQNVNNSEFLYSLLDEFCKNSLIQPELKNELECLTKSFTKLSTQNNVIINTLQTPTDIIEKYKDLSYCWSNCHPKQKKNKLDEINVLMREYKSLQTDLEFYNKHLEIEKELDEIAIKINNVKEYFTNEIKQILQCLKDEDFISEVETNQYKIKRKGQYAAHIQEAHPLVLADFLEKYNYFKDFSNKKEAASFLSASLSIFASISLPDDCKVYPNDIQNQTLRNYAIDITDYNEKYFNIEIEKIGYQITQENKLTYDICEPTLAWCEADDNDKCKNILQELNYYQIFTGDYIKAILKIVKMCKELQKPAELLMDYEFLQILTFVSDCLLKFIATNQSLYI